MVLKPLLIVFLPLMGAMAAGMGRKRLGDFGSQLITCFCMAGAAFMASILWWDVTSRSLAFSFPLFTWIDVGLFKVEWGLFIDSLSATMMAVVTVVSLMVHIYAVGYMHHDKSIPRFMAYLSLFTFFMLMLVTSPNLVQLFFGWEGVGLASYLLIGFWFEKPSACAASMKAFLVNRVGDIGLALGVFTLFSVFKTVSFSEIFAQGSLSETFSFLGFSVPAIPLAMALLFMGAMGKSAQLGLHTWLPDAMEGPTPVSALIHAATMVTAGVFLMVRMSPLLEYAPAVKDFILWMGAATAIFAATVGCTQNDIKRVIAYSTCSQLGFMFMAIGVGAYHVAIFHLATHAFFKALLFLGAGSVIHALSGEQNLQKMGGIWRKIPITYGIMWIGNLALAGIPYFAGYFSKDLILEHLWFSGSYVYGVALVGTFLTAFYSWRLLLLAFHGPTRENDEVLSRVHESPMVMLVPLLILAVGAIFAGCWGMPLIGKPSYWGNSLFFKTGEEHLPILIHWLPTIMAGLGVVVAFVFYSVVKALPDLMSRIFRPLYIFFFNKWFFDELYNLIWIRPSLWLGHVFWKRGDRDGIDRFGPNGFASFSLGVAQMLRSLQTGYLFHYAFVMVGGVILLMTYFMIRG